MYYSKNSSKIDHEVEIAIVIGKKAKYVSEKDAQDYILDIPYVMI